MSDNTLPVPLSQLLQLIELAESALIMQYTEFSNGPTDEDRDLMLSLWRLVGKEVPPYFFRYFGWTLG